MWFPGRRINSEFRDMIIAAFNDEEVKKEFSKRFDENMQEERYKNNAGLNARIDSGRSKNGIMQSYDELTSGNVNLQAKLAASGYDVYGRTILSGHKDTSHKNVYRKMKNKIQYRSQPRGGYDNRGDRTII